MWRDSFVVFACFACAVDGRRARPLGPSHSEQQKIAFGSGLRVTSKRQVGQASVAKALTAFLLMCSTSAKCHARPRAGRATSSIMSNRAWTPYAFGSHSKIVPTLHPHHIQRVPFRHRGMFMQADSNSSNADLKFSLPSALPSLSLLLQVFILAQVISDLRMDRLAAWVAAGFPISNAPFGLFVNIGFAAFILNNLVKFLGIAKSSYYGNLEGFEENSLSRQAGEWALAGIVPKHSEDQKYEVATFAGGCFWGTELHFQRIPGVVATCVGYTQGRVESPSYGQVCSGMTGHTEGIQLLYDPDIVSYSALCDKLLSTVDSAALNRVGNDMGTQYRHGIYPHSEAQMAEAIEAIAREQKMQGQRKVVTEVMPATVFWPAEKYHQRYLQKGGQSAEKNAIEAVRCYG